MPVDLAVRGLAAQAARGQQRLAQQYSGNDSTTLKARSRCGTTGPRPPDPRPGSMSTVSSSSHDNSVKNGASPHLAVPWWPSAHSGPAIRGPGPASYQPSSSSVATRLTVERHAHPLADLGPADCRVPAAIRSSSAARAITGCYHQGNRSRRTQRSLSQDVPRAAASPRLLTEAIGRSAGETYRARRSAPDCGASSPCAGTRCPLS